MFSWIRQRRVLVAPDPVDQFHRNVEDCAKVLARRLLPLGRRYSAQALIVGLMMHLRGAIALCLREGQISESQARLMVDALLRMDVGAQSTRSARPEDARANPPRW